MRKRPTFVFNNDCIIYRKYGLFANGENGQGMAIKMIANASENHSSIVLNFSLSVSLLFANAEPIVTITIAASMSVLCIIPKNE